MEMEKINQQLKLIPQLETERSPVGFGRQTNASNFGDVLKDAINDVNSLQIQAGKAIEQMVSGEASSIHDVMIAAEKARTSFDLLMEVRNKTLDMYREMMRIQI